MIFTVYIESYEFIKKFKSLYAFFECIVKRLQSFVFIKKCYLNFMIVISESVLPIKNFCKFYVGSAELDSLTTSRFYILA